MLDRYNVLQSGFICIENKKLKRPNYKDEDLEFDSYILNKPQRHDDNVYFYHSGIDYYYQEYKNDQRKALNFDFREKFLLEVFDALANTSLADWVYMQNENSNLTELHREFVLDMLNFIIAGKRKVSPESWDLLITKDNVYDKRHYTAIDLKDYFKAPSTSGDRIPISAVGTVQTWLSKDMGFSDMIVTMGTIFGKRPLINNAE